MRASGEHNIISFNEFNKFSNEHARIYYSIYHMPQKRILNCKKDHLSPTRLSYNANV